MSSFLQRNLCLFAALALAVAASACESPEATAPKSGGGGAANAPRSDSATPRGVGSTPTTPARSETAHGGGGGGAEGTSAPDFELVDSNGSKVRLSDYKGKVVILDFWATWCPPCRKEIPGFVDIQSRYKNKGVEVVGVSLDQGWDPVRPFMKAQRINYTVVLGDMAVVRSYGNITSIPTTFVIDRDGVIRERHVGYAPPQFFTDAVDPLL